ncbi:MAG TPA: hypothetical protein VHU18_03420 [Rhizomicrobium sp.]|jgi:integrase|nr:hypothetical protein [Rhizomicrobium sp.]
MSEVHVILGGKVRVYQRERSPYWQCSAFLSGRKWRASTKTDSLAHAKEFAEDWFLDLSGKSRAGLLKTGRTFKEAAEKFLPEYELLTLGERNPRYVKQHGDRLRVHLRPFFGDKLLSEITPGLVQEYRIHRTKTSSTGRPPARATLHHEIVTLRLVLKAASRHGWLEHVPDLSPPYKASNKISHRAWFSPDEYRKLYEATRKRAKAPLKKQHGWGSEQLHDYVLFMANTGLRPDESARLQYRDVSVVVDQATGERILEIEVRGKRGVGYCKSMPGAVVPFERLKARNKPAATDRLFPQTHRALFNAVLDEEGLKVDRDGQRRTAYSLRHTYICMRLMEGADIYQIAKNCRTSVEMIENFYASHIKNTLDAAAINVRRAKSKNRRSSDGRASRPNRASVM